MQVINENDVAACGPQYARPPLAEAAAEADDGIGMREVFSLLFVVSLFICFCLFTSNRLCPCVCVLVREFVFVCLAYYRCCCSCSVPYTN